MSKGFIKKNWQKDASTVLISTGIRGGSAIATAWGCKKISDASKSTTVHNLVGPGFLLLGTLGDMMIENDYLKAACQGISTYGMLYTISTIASDSVAPAIGMNGINDTAALFSGVGALGETTSVDYTGQSPEEFAWANGQQVIDSDGKTYNNDWNYLAENIDYADQITKSVNGVAEDAAALMGVPTEAEAQNLLGMF